jgi:BMFP domain-containing protein YqiC
MHKDHTARPAFDPEGLEPAGPNLADLARKLAAALPGVLGGARRDVETQLQAVLQAQMSKLDLCSRQDFDVQAKVLERTRERLQQLETRAAALEARLKDIEAGQVAR